MRRVLRSKLFQVAQTRPFGRLVGALEAWRSRDCGRLAVLMYHRVDEFDRRPDLDPALISATPEAFRLQMGFLRDHCHVVSLDEVLSAVQGRSRLPSRAVLITFDDAYSDFSLHAWPVLREHGLPVTVFVPTAYPEERERAFWWDRLHQALHSGVGPEALAGVLPDGQAGSTSTKRLRNFLKELPHEETIQRVEEIARRGGLPPARNEVLDWDALRALASEGVTLAPHTRTHPLLTRVSPGEARAEIARSIEDLKRELRGGPIPAAFAFPSGAHNASVRQILKELGVKAAFLTQRGVNRLGRCDPLQLARINVGRTTPLELLRLQMAL